MMVTTVSLFSVSLLHVRMIILWVLLFSVSITRDGEYYGTAATYRVFNGDCLSCPSAAEECTIAVSHCVTSLTLFVTHRRTYQHRLKQLTHSKHKNTIIFEHPE